MQPTTAPGSQRSHQCHKFENTFAAAPTSLCFRNASCLVTCTTEPTYCTTLTGSSPVQCLPGLVNQSVLSQLVFSQLNMYDILNSAYLHAPAVRLFVYGQAGCSGSLLFTATVSVDGPAVSLVNVCSTQSLRLKGSYLLSEYHILRLCDSHASKHHDAKPRDDADISVSLCFLSHNVAAHNSPAVYNSPAWAISSSRI